MITVTSATTVTQNVGLVTMVTSAVKSVSALMKVVTTKPDAQVFFHIISLSINTLGVFV